MSQGGQSATRSFGPLGDSASARASRARERESLAPPRSCPGAARRERVPRAPAPTRRCSRRRGSRRTPSPSRTSRPPPSRTAARTRSSPPRRGRRRRNRGAAAQLDAGATQVAIQPLKALALIRRRSAVSHPSSSTDRSPLPSLCAGRACVPDDRALRVRPDRALRLRPTSRLAPRCAVFRRARECRPSRGSSRARTG